MDLKSSLEVSHDEIMASQRDQIDNLVSLREQVGTGLSIGEADKEIFKAKLDGRRSLHDVEQTRRRKPYDVPVKGE